MKLSEAAKYLPFVQAAAEGKTIQYKNTAEVWLDCDMENILSFDNPPEFYRIKPAPKFRAWNKNDVQVGALIKKTDFTPQIILGCDDMGVQLIWGFNMDGINGKIHYHKLLDSGYSHSLDNGKTWLPCGIQE